MAEQRASDADRERAADHLRRAGGDGRLTVEELSERVELAYGARTRPELERLLEDVEEGPHAPALRRPATASGLTVRPGGGGARWVVSLMGSATRRGRWRVSPHVTVLSVMGSSELDLNDAELAADEVTLTLLSVMGGAKVRVPEHARLAVTNVGIMGGNDVQGGEDPDADGPLIRLRLISVMGGTSVKRGRRRRGRDAPRLPGS